MKFEVNYSGILTCSPHSQVHEAGAASHRRTFTFEANGKSPEEFQALFLRALRKSGAATYVCSNSELERMLFYLLTCFLTSF